MKRKILVCVAGLGGAIGSTLAAGVYLSKKNKYTNIGLVTESSPVQKVYNNFASLNSMIISGWDVNDSSLYSAVLKHGVICKSNIEEIKSELSALAPRLAYSCCDIKLEEWFREEVRIIEQIKRKAGASNVIIVNVCPTEPASHQKHDINNWINLNALDATMPGITPSRIYFRLAIEAKAHYINFTPNFAEINSLRKLAEEKNIVYCGRDGKTGQTFIKTILAPAFRDRNLQIDGWFSTNILGNSDGSTLSNFDCFMSKQISKSQCLEAILGYSPGGEGDQYSHQVQIHYYPPRGDAKEAWDSIDFTGFLGERMQMKINWLGKDSILAVPSILDLIRIIDLAVQNKEHGVLEYLAYFFKTPLIGTETSACHETPVQFGMLLNHLQSICKN